MERKTKIKHSHSTVKRYWATRGRESSCNILLCHLCCPDLYGPLLLLPPTDKYRVSWSCDGLSDNEMSFCSASVLGGIQDPPCSVVDPPSPCLLWYQLIPWPTMGNLQPEVCEWSSAWFSLESSREALLWMEAQEWGDLPTSSYALPVWWHWYVTATDNSEFSSFPGMAVLFLCCSSVACRQLSAV